MSPKPVWSAFVRLALRLVLLLLIAIGFASPGAGMARAQGGLQVTEIITDNNSFPSMTVYVTIADSAGLALRDVETASFGASEGGQPVKNLVTEYKHTDRPVSIAVLIDLSGSMFGRPLENTIVAARQFVNGLGSQDQVALITFAKEITTVVPLTTDLTTVQTAIGNLAVTPDAPTPLHDAVVKGLDTLAGVPSGRKAVVLITDGQESGTSKLTFEQVVAKAVDAKIPIHSVAFGTVYPDPLEQLALLTRGSAQIEKGSAEIGDSFAKLIAVLHEQYVLAYTSPLTADGKEHKLNVTFKYKGTDYSRDVTFIAQPREVVLKLPSPTEGQEVGGVVALAPEIIPPAGAQIVQVEYLLDDRPFTTVSLAPFNYSWDASKVSPGSHRLTVRATDNAGNSAEVAVGLKVRPPIIVTLTAPDAGAKIAQPVKFAATVDSLDAVAKVDFKVDGKVVGSATAAPYEYEWDPRGSAAGPHQISVVAQDVAGNVSTEDTRPVEVAVRGSGIIFVVIGLVVALLFIFVAASGRRRRATAYAGSGVGAPASLPPGWLVVEQGGGAGQRWPVGPAETRLGRKRADNDIPIEDLRASRQHAVIRPVGSRLIFADLKPGENPSAINGQPLAGEHPLAEGDTITVGETIFRFTQIPA